MLGPLDTMLGAIRLYYIMVSKLNVTIIQVVFGRLH